MNWSRNIETRPKNKRCNMRKGITETDICEVVSVMMNEPYTGDSFEMELKWTNYEPPEDEL